ncbi:uncharacterized protein LOC120192275 [Hibiscus syriacus]|uniref:uncharacterized protein LOC120192275 n=1 Tax=Hibiscus syriacus TaxID=106335 RepID=UPI001923A46D|nr:uncharacterized protein LOC120192275 [Hibiscus syriacus]
MPSKHTEKKKIFSQQRPTFEINTPKVRKSQFVSQTEDQEKTLNDVLENMHFKGLLKNNSIKEPVSCQSIGLFSGNRLINNSPPIVLIKPRHDPHLLLQEKFAPVFQEGSLNSETMLRKSKVNVGKMSRRVEAKETPVKRHIRQEDGKDRQVKETRAVTKQVKIKQSFPTKVKCSSSITRASLKKMPTPKNINMMPKPMIGSRKPVEKEIAKAKNLSRSKDQAKVAPRKLCKPENPSNVTKNKILHQPSATANEVANSNLVNLVCRPQSTVRGPIDEKKSSTKKALTKATIAKISDRNVIKCSLASVQTEKLQCKGDKVVLEGKKIVLVSENDTVLEEKSIDIASNNDTVLEGKGFVHELENNTIVEGYGAETAEELSTEEGTEHTDIQIGEHCSESYVCDVTLVTTDDQNSRKSFDEVDDDHPITPIGANSESFTKRINLKALLLSSPAFMNHVDELFDLHVDVPIASQKFGIGDFSDADSRFSFDCAKEIVQRKSHPNSRMLLPPWLSLVGDTKMHLSLDHLLKETCDGVEDLRRYSEISGKNYPTVRLYAMMERDINHSEALSGIWDLGWKKRFSVDDTIQVVEDIEKELLRGLIAEICS